MADERVILLACDNPWLASSAQALLCQAGGFVRVSVCTLADVLLAAAHLQPSVIVVFAGVSTFLHAERLAGLRVQQPAAVIVLAIGAETALFAAHASTRFFNVLIDESRLSQELIPAIRASTAGGGGKS